MKKSGRIEDSVIELIRQRISVSQVVGQKVRLKRAGREMRGLSPFNNEKTPSFYVNDAKGFYHCFSSGKHGDVFDFLMETEGLTFVEAAEQLADQAGVQVTREKMTAQQEQTRKVRASAVEALACADQFFRACLRQHKPALDYLANRGVSRASIERFGIGWAPADRFALKNHLIREGFPLDVQIEAGLLVSEEVSIPYAFYRGRVTIPITNRQGKTISFGARGIAGEEPKYLNGRETALFDKGMTLFNLHGAAASITKAGKAVVMEGYLDVISTVQAGLENVVAPLGTALTPEHLQSLWRVSPIIIVCFDGDKPGVKAANRTLDTALPWVSGDRRMMFAELPAGVDPDDMIRSAGIGHLRQLVDTPQMFGDRVWQFLREETPGEAPEDRAKIEASARTMLEVISDPDMRRAFTDAMLSRARVIGRPRYRNEPEPVLLERRSDNGIPPREAALIYAALQHPSYVEDDIEAFAALEMDAPVTARIHDLIMKQASNGRAVDIDAIAREVAMLRDTLPVPLPSFVTGENADGFRSAAGMHKRQARRKRLKGS